MFRNRLSTHSIFALLILILLPIAAHARSGDACGGAPSSRDEALGAAVTYARGGLAADEALTELTARYRLDVVAGDRTLAEAGYGARARAEAIRRQYDVEVLVPMLAAVVDSSSDAYLMLQAWGYGPASAGTLADYYGGSSTEEIAADLIEQGADDTEVVGLLIFMGWSLDEILALFETHEWASEVEVLKTVATLLAERGDALADWNGAILDRLLERLFELYDAASAADLLHEVGLGWDVTVRLLLRAGYTVEAIVLWLEDQGLSADRVARALKAAQILAGVALDEMIHAGFRTVEVVAAIGERFQVELDEMAELLFEAGVDAVEAADALIDHYGPIAADALEDLMVAAGYASELLETVILFLNQKAYMMNEINKAVIKNM